MIEAKNIHKTYKNGRHLVSVLKGVDLSIEGGKIITILGHSGAGKSTLLNLLGGLDKPSEGSVIFKGQDFSALKDDQLAKIRNTNIGFVFQFYHLLPEFTALENVVMPGLLYRNCTCKELFQRGVHLLEEMGLAERVDHKPKALSGGEQQRVAIARALMNDPNIILCDEPTGNLDLDTAKVVLDLLWKLNKEQGKTFVIVTHEKEIAEKSDVVVHIENGIIKK